MFLTLKMFLQKLTKGRVNFSPTSFPVSVSEAEREHTLKKGLRRQERIPRKLRVICLDRHALIRCSLPTWSLAWRQSGFSVVLEVLAILKVLIRNWGAAALWGIFFFSYIVQGLLHSGTKECPVQEVTYPTCSLSFLSVFDTWLSCLLFALPTNPGLPRSLLTPSEGIGLFILIFPSLLASNIPNSVQSTDRGPEEETTRTYNLFVSQRTQRPLPPKGTLRTYILSSVAAELWNGRPLHTWASAWVGFQRPTARSKGARNHGELAFRRVCDIPSSLMKWQQQ